MVMLLVPFALIQYKMVCLKQPLVRMVAMNTGPKVPLYTDKTWLLSPGAGLRQCIQIGCYNYDIRECDVYTVYRLLDSAPHMNFSRKRKLVFLKSVF